VIEVEAARLFRRFRLPTPDRQVCMTLPDRSARVDCYWGRPGVVAELDGRMHMDAAQWVDDLDRQNKLGLTERLVLRYPLWTFRFHPDRVADQLARAFSRSIGETRLRPRGR
jgi:very-short-patch-repair endonuclease